MSLDFGALPLPANALLFAVGALGVWFAGIRLAALGDSIAVTTGWGGAFIGLVFLAGATELPELVTTVSAAAMGDPTLALNNMFGGIAMQTAILVAADFAAGRLALTSQIRGNDTPLQGLFLLLLLSLCLGAVLVGEWFSFSGVGLWSCLLFLGYLCSVRQCFGKAVHRSTRAQEPSEARVWLLARQFVGASALVLVGGVVLVASAESLATQTGLGSSFVGATLVASSTSLPELSTTLAAVRMGAYSMAIGNIFGSNAIMIALLLVADVAYREGPILNRVDGSAQFACALGMAVTVVYTIALVRPPRRNFGRIGADSLVVLVLYILGLVGLYTLR